MKIFRRTTREFSPRDERGQTMTEFAFVLPLLALLLFAILQLGLTLRDYLMLTEATRDGARKAAVGRHMKENPSSAAEAEVRRIASGLDQSKLKVQVASSWARGGQVRVSATYPYEISLLGFVTADGTLESAATEQVE